MLVRTTMTAIEPGTQQITVIGLTSSTGLEEKKAVRTLVVR